MRKFSEMNPLAVTIYYLAVTSVTMFSMNPVILALSLVSSVLYCCMYSRGSRHIFCLAVFLITAVINPLTVHNGATVLFYLNSRAFTLESALYGLSAAAMITATLYRLSAMSRELSSEKLMYLFGRFSPKLALILSMSLRYAALFRRRRRMIRDSQRALGLYADGNLIDAARGNLRLLSILITWSIENGILTAESMEARGYGSRRRTSFAVFRFTAGDGILIALTLLLASAAAAGIYAADFTYYPRLGGELLGPLSVTGYTAYAVLCAVPMIINAKEAIRWRYSTSAI